MRSKEQFKAYVYEKADAARVRNKKMRAIALRGVAAFSLFVVVGGVLLFTDVANDATMSSEAMPVSEMENGLVYGVAELQAVLDCAEAVAETNAAAKGSKSTATVQYSSKSEYTGELQDGGVYYATTLTAADGISYTIAESAEAYKGDLENIDFEKNVALVLENCSGVSNCKIEYTEASIVVTVSMEEVKSESPATYTILLNKSKYNGQPIEVVFE